MTSCEGREETRDRSAAEEQFAKSREDARRDRQGRNGHQWLSVEEAARIAPREQIGMFRCRNVEQPVARRGEGTRVAMIVAGEEIHEPELEELTRDFRDPASAKQSGGVHLD